MEAWCAGCGACSGFAAIVIAGPERHAARQLGLGRIERGARGFQRVLNHEELRELERYLLTRATVVAAQRKQRRRAHNEAMAESLARRRQRDRARRLARRQRYDALADLLRRRAAEAREKAGLPDRATVLRAREEARRTRRAALARIRAQRQRLSGLRRELRTLSGTRRRTIPRNHEPPTG